LVKQDRQTAAAVRQVALLFSIGFLIACPLAALYTGEWGQTLSGFWTILTSPCPLVTDYFRLGNLSAAFLNAGLCGMSCVGLLFIPGARCRRNAWAGYFLVVAHCFYGLNLLSMWPSILGILLYCKVTKRRFRDNLGMAMFSTAFGPFVSELLFRYPLHFDMTVNILGTQFNLFGLPIIAIFGVFLGFAIPATLPGAKLLHRNYNLYNGGLACGLLGLFIYAFLFKTMGVPAPEAIAAANPVYDAHHADYAGFSNIFFAVLFGACLLIGWIQNGHSFKGYGKLMQDKGYRADFFRDYGAPMVWINLGVYGLMMLLYFDLVTGLTVGAGFTGATCGVTLAAMTFASSGQHPKNVWPILAGYCLLSLGVSAFNLALGRAIPWSLSTQGYMNGVAFGTGLCPFSGKYGNKVGIVAGFICAVMCTTTSAMHGGFVLYNGGLTAGITALILLPLLDMYDTHKNSEQAG